MVRYFQVCTAWIRHGHTASCHKIDPILELSLTDNDGDEDNDDDDGDDDNDNDDDDDNADDDNDNITKAAVSGSDPIVELSPADGLPGFRGEARIPQISGFKFRPFKPLGGGYAYWAAKPTTIARPVSEKVGEAVVKLNIFGPIYREKKFNRLSPFCLRCSYHICSLKNAVVIL